MTGRQDEVAIDDHPGALRDRRLIAKPLTGT
jgi:hypothetical protein